MRRWAERVSRIMVVAGPVVALLIVFSPPAAAEMVGPCFASFNGIDFDDIDTVSEAKERMVLEEGDTLVFVAGATQDVDEVFIDIVMRPWSFQLIGGTEEDKTGDDTGTFEMEIAIEDLAVFGAGIYEMQGRTDICKGNAYFIIGGVAPWETVAGQGALGIGAVGLLGALTSWVPAATSGGGGYGRSIFGGLLLGLASALLAQQTAFLPLTATTLAAGAIGGPIVVIVITQLLGAIGGGGGAAAATATATGGTATSGAGTGTAGASGAGSGAGTAPSGGTGAGTTGAGTGGTGAGTGGAGSTGATGGTGAGGTSTGAGTGAGTGGTSTSATGAGTGASTGASSGASAGTAGGTGAGTGGTGGTGLGGIDPTAGGTGTGATGTGTGAGTGGTGLGGIDPSAGGTGTGAGTGGTGLGGIDPTAGTGAGTAAPQPPITAGPGGMGVGVGGAIGAAGALGSQALSAMARAIQRRQAGDADPVAQYWFHVEGYAPIYDLNDAGVQVGFAQAGQWYLAKATYDEWIHMVDDDNGIEAWIPGWAAVRGD